MHMMDAPKAYHLVRIGDLPSAPQPERPPTIAITFYFVSPFLEVYKIGFY